MIGVPRIVSVVLLCLTIFDLLEMGIQSGTRASWTPMLQYCTSGQLHRTLPEALGSSYTSA